MSLLAADDAGPQTGKRNADHYTREGIWIDTDGQVGEDFQMIRMSALASRLKRRLLPVDRPPDQLVGDPDAPYIFRWRLWPKNPLINAYLHNVVRADDEAALHDHPWPSVSIMLAGTIDETFAARKGEKVRKLRAGDVVLRKSASRTVCLLSSPNRPGPSSSPGPASGNGAFIVPRAGATGRHSSRPEKVANTTVATIHRIIRKASRPE